MYMRRMLATTGLDTKDASVRFRALGDETRLRILETLIAGEQCVCDLTDALGIGQSLLSFHLKTLKEAGIVSDRREGRWVHYSLEPEALEGLRALLGTFTGPRRTARRAPGRCL